MPVRLRSLSHLLPGEDVLFYAEFEEGWNWELGYLQPDGHIALGSFSRGFSPDHKANVVGWVPLPRTPENVEGHPPTSLRTPFEANAVHAWNACPKVDPSFRVQYFEDLPEKLVQVLDSLFEVYTSMGGAGMSRQILALAVSDYCVNHRGA